MRAVVLEPPLELLGTLDRRRIPEASGIVKSRRYPEIFWVHNDSGNPPLLFAIRRDGRIVRQFRLEVPNIDWEDIAIDDQGHLYLGDIGNNGGVLPVRVIYRIDEPDPAGAARSAAPPRRLRPSIHFPPRNGLTPRAWFTTGGPRSSSRSISIAGKPGSSPFRSRRRRRCLRPAHPRSIGLLAGFHGARDRRGPQRQTGPPGGLLVGRHPGLPARRGSARWRLLSEVRYRSQPIEGIAWDGRDLVLVAEGGGLYRLAETTWRRRRRNARTRPAKSRSSEPSARSPVDRGTCSDVTVA